MSARNPFDVGLIQILHSLIRSGFARGIASTTRLAAKRYDLDTRSTTVAISFIEAEAKTSAGLPQLIELPRQVRKEMRIEFWCQGVPARTADLTK